MSTENMEKTEYGADQIQILEGLEAVREAPRYVYRQYLRTGDFTIWSMRLSTTR